jgi:small GTP-binding protein
MDTAKSERIHICFFGRTNVGKSSIINLISGQDISIVSSIAGTTTDSVEKAMELAPIGPVVLIDTAGIDDVSDLAFERQKKTNSIFQKCDFACLIVEPNK